MTEDLERLSTDELRERLEGLDTRIQDAASQPEVIELLRSKGRLTLVLAGRPQVTATEQRLPSDDVNLAVGNRVRMARALSRMTQGRLAEAAGITQWQLSRIERGIRTVTVPELLRLAAELQKPVAFFTKEPTWEAALLRP